MIHYLTAFKNFRKFDVYAWRDACNFFLLLLLLCKFVKIKTQVVVFIQISYNEFPSSPSRIDQQFSTTVRKIYGYV